MNKAYLATVGAFLMWGLFPLYWRALAQVPALQIMAHRLVWCCVLVTGYLVARRGFGWWRTLQGGPKLYAMLMASALLIGNNWLLYIWAVNNGHVVETSLGYFINPLVNVLLAVTVLRERLNLRQWLAVAIAASGVLYLTVEVGRLPWIALDLAFSFGSYGLLRKLVPVDALPGLVVESCLLFLPGLAYLVWAEVSGFGHFGHTGFTTDLLLVAGGLVTALPLIWFAYGARRIPYSTVGVIQYIAPTLQLLCGVVVFGEPFTHADAVGFGCIWMALALYAWDGLRRLRMDRG